jgi:carboxyl-terminal processing protease
MKKIIIISTAIAIGVLVGFLIQPAISGDNVYQEVRKFNNVLNYAYKNYVEEVDTHAMVEAAIKGMLNELDVHSVYIDSKDMKKVKEDFQGSFEGIGVQFDVINDTITIVAPIVGGPSEGLGILSGDKIIKIDGEKAVGLSRDEVPKKLKGPKGTKVEVDIKRGNEKELLNFVITRDKIPLYSVDGKFIIDGTDIGVIQINRFSSTTYTELMDALKELKGQGMQKLVLDLRGNPGGFLRKAFEMADEFLAAGDTIVYTKGRRPNLSESFEATRRGSFKDIPLIVMVNAGSASASEIVSGAVQDLDRGLVVGTTSYGKGLVQRQETLSDGSGFRITIAKYYTPSGRCIQRPYKDKDAYRHLVGRLDLEEGSYIQDPIAKIKRQIDSVNKDLKEDDEKYIHFEKLELYKTKSGRTVFGGGGITPDYIVKMDTINMLSRKIRSKNIMFEFSNDYLTNAGKEIKANYENDFTKFYREYEVSEDCLNAFKELAIEKGVEWNDEQFEEDKDYLKTSIKVTFARIMWDSNKATQVFSSIDNQLLKAIELFPEAKRIAQLN